MIDIISKLEKKLKSLSDDDVQTPRGIDIMNEVSWEIATTNPKRSFDLSKESRKISKELKYKKGLAYSYRNLGYYYFISSNHKTALKYTKEAFHIFKKLRDKAGQATIFDIFALIYWRMGIYDKAFEYSYRSLDLNQKIENRRGEAWALFNIGSIYLEMGDHELSIKNYQKSLKLFQEISYTPGEGRIFSGLGEVCHRSGDLKKAIEYYRECLKIDKKLKIIFGISSDLTAIGSIYLEMGEFDNAFESFDASMKLFDKFENKELKSRTILNLGKLYAKQGKLENALKLLKLSLKTIKKTKAKPMVYQIHKAMSDIYDARKEYKNALKHYKEFHRLKDKVFNEEKTKNIKNIQIRNEVEKAEKETEIHRLKYIELAEMQSQLIQSEKMALLGNLVSGLAHEINTPIGVINSNTDVSDRAIEKIIYEIENAYQLIGSKKNIPFQKALDIIRSNSKMTAQAGEKIANLINSLKNFAKLDQAKYQTVNIHEGIENTLSLMRFKLPDTIKLVKKYGDLPKLRCHPQELNQVFMTLLTNASDAMNQKGTLKIETSLNNNHVYVKISDTGKGLSNKNLERIFEIGFSEKDSKMRMNVGLAYCYNIIKKHNGEIIARSKEKKGTTFEIKLPVRIGD